MPEDSHPPEHHTIPFYPTPPSDASAELNAALARASIDDAKTMSRLQASVRRFTRSLRDRGTAPEAVLLALKSSIHDQLQNTAAHGGIAATEKLRVKVMAWMIEEYFVTDLAAQAPTCSQ